MNKILNYKGQLTPGTQTTILLSTKKGEKGYRINKFQIMSSTPGVGDVEFVAQIYKTDETNNINTTPDFSDNRLLGAVYYQDGASQVYPSSTEVIFDQEIINQDIFLNITSPNGSAVRCNYYLELETIPLNEMEAMVTTLKDIRSNQ